jgi:hypothetical protein
VVVSDAVSKFEVQSRGKVTVSNAVRVAAEEEEEGGGGGSKDS